MCVLGRVGGEYWSTIHVKTQISVSHSRTDISESLGEDGIEA